MTLFTHLGSKLQRSGTSIVSIKALILLCLWMGFSGGSILHAQSAPAITTEETPIFNFPRQIGNVWVYEWEGNCRGEKDCVHLRKELIDEIDVDGISCSVFKLTKNNGQEHREITWCFDDNKIYWPRTDIHPDTNRVDLVADFSQPAGHRWLLSNVVNPNEEFQRVRVLDIISNDGKFYSFTDYGTNDLETLDGDTVSPNFLMDDSYIIGDYLTFSDNIGLLSYGDACSYCSHHIKGRYIDGVLAGDTTFYYATSIDYEPGLPSEFELGAYPNPFNPTTQIRFSLPMESAVELDVYTITGRHVANLVSEIRPAGTHQVTFDASDLASGVYMYRIRAGNYIETRKLTLIR